MKVYLLAIIALFVAAKGSAQELLTLDSAIARAVAYNYDVRIADVTRQAADVNHSIGNAGLLPNINGSASINQGFANTRLVRSEGTVTQVNGASTLSYGAGVNAGYTVFAGGRAWLLYRQLGQREELAGAQLRAQVQSTISAVIQAYAAVVNDQRQAVAIDTGIALAKARMDLSKAKYDIGTSAKVDYLQARVDYNAARSQRLAQDATQAASTALLNELMGQDGEMSYDVEDSLYLNLALSPADSSLLESRSPLLDASRINVEIARYDRKIARTYYLPTVGASAGYNYSRTQSDASLLQSNRSVGPNIGLNLSVPIFQGVSIRRATRLASLNELSAELQYSRQAQSISRQYRTAWAAYQGAVATYTLEDENRGYARENLDIQRARFRLGVATSLEMREAESSYVATLARYNAARYNAKVAETRVLEIEARLDAE